MDKTQLVIYYNLSTLHCLQVPFHPEYLFEQEFPYSFLQDLMPNLKFLEMRPMKRNEYLNIFLLHRL